MKARPAALASTGDLVAVGLAGNENWSQFRLLALAEDVQNPIYHPAGHHHSDPNRREHRKEKNKYCYQRVQVRPILMKSRNLSSTGARLGAPPPGAARLTTMYLR